MSGPKILFLDIETAPIEVYAWQLYGNDYVPPSMLKKDWHLLSWSAKWHGSKKIYFASQQSAKDVTNDKKILQKLVNLLNKADVVVTHNGVKFDQPKIMSRLAIHNIDRPAPFKSFDTLKLCKKHFGFTSNKLAFIAKRLDLKFQKIGDMVFEDWLECLAGKRAAWAKMKAYNIRDILVLEELYERLLPWDNTINFNLYNSGHEYTCSCGSTDFEQRGYRYTTVGKYKQFKCKKCGKFHQGTVNMLGKITPDNKRKPCA